MSDPSPTPESEETDADQAGQSAAPGENESLDEDDYALGRTSDPGGAEREEPAGEDYAGSGF